MSFQDKTDIEHCHTITEIPLNNPVQIRCGDHFRCPHFTQPNKSLSPHDTITTPWLISLKGLEHSILGRIVG